MEKLVNNHKRYTLDEIQRNTYYQMPRFLIEDEAYSGLSNDAKILYTILRDLHSLSIKNGWVNEKGEVYLICTRNKMENLLKRSNRTVLNLVNSLKDYNLIEEHRQGLGRPNLIYLLIPVTTKTYKPTENPQNPSHETLDSTGTCNDYMSDNGTLSCMEMTNFHGNKNNYIKTDISQSQSQSHVTAPENFGNDMTDNDMTLTAYIPNQTERNNTKAGRAVDPTPAPPPDNAKPLNRHAFPDVSEYDAYEERIKSNIEYDILIEDGCSQGFVDLLVNNMMDVIFTREYDIDFGNRTGKKPRETVERVFMGLDMFHIQHVIHKYEEQGHQIVHKRNYIRTMLFNARLELDAWAVNQPRADGVIPSGSNRRHLRR